MSQEKLTESDRDRDAMRKRDSHLADRRVHVRPLSVEVKPAVNGERLGVAIEDSTPIPDDPDGHHTVRVLLDSGSEQ